MVKLRVISYGEDILRKPAKEINKLSSKIQKLIDDMLETMYAQNGVGLAATQVGENYRIFVIDTSAEDEPKDPIIFVNPKIVKKSGAVNSYEGCLSFPNAFAYVRRYSAVTVKAKDRKGRPFSLQAKDGTLLCRAIQHENDHLDGILFIDHTRNRFATDGELSEKGLPSINPDYLIDEDELEAKIQEQEKIEKE